MEIMYDNLMNNNKRPSWDEYFMQIAISTARRSTCFSEAKGAILVKNLRIISTGYSGAPSGVSNCKYDNKICRKRKLGYGHGKGHDECLAVHAEANAILSAARQGISTENSVLYCTHKPCENCVKMIINAGITIIVYLMDYESKFADELICQSGLKILKLEMNLNEQKDDIINM